MLRVVVLISGGGSNLRALLEAAQDAEFLVWTTYQGDPIRSGVIEEIGTAFGEENGVSFTHRAWALEELQETLPRTVDSDQGPAVSQVNNGESLAGPMARASSTTSTACPPSGTRDQVRRRSRGAVSTRSTSHPVGTAADSRKRRPRRTSYSRRLVSEEDVGVTSQFNSCRT